ncbi:hypothetical protein TWF694_007258 [Orbilia ellipsospora]|uniref:Uncharacterized protein n=1 Tax=Orbilia ellipsospora TaxID=2528407 RepID=A0AAV9XKL2_9PEZI
MSNNLIQKRVPVTILSTDDSDKEDTWLGQMVSDRCSDGQKNAYRLGWLESGYMAKVFSVSLEELRFQRALGDYFGDDWKSSSVSQRIIDNYNRLANLHRGGSYFADQKLYIYCDEHDTPKDTLDHCGTGGCCQDEATAGAGTYVYVEQGETSTNYSIVLCPNYFQTKGWREIFATIDKNNTSLVGDIWTFYPSQGTMLLREQIRLPFLSNSYIGDLFGKVDIDPYYAAVLALQYPEYASRIAQNYAIAALAVTQAFVFNLPEPPRWANRPVPPPQFNSISNARLANISTEGGGGSPKPSFKKPKASGLPSTFTPVPVGMPLDIANLPGYGWLNSSLPKLPGAKSLPKALNRANLGTKGDPRLKKKNAN